ncbi:MAG: peptidoglycan-binding protein [Desulfovibrionaceae bacterium]|nr:peptidoglycan-binding protein [Desulfovibrionaceae bacterium]
MHIFRFIPCLISCLALMAGCMTAASTTAPDLPVVQPQSVSADQLSGSDMTALMTLDLARNGALPEVGPIRLAPGAKVDMVRPEPGFIEKEAKLSHIATLPDGSTLLEVARRYEDGYGRVQMFMDMAGYTVRRPTDEEAQVHALSLVMDYRAILNSGNAELVQETQESVRGFQEQAGLSVDGVLGSRTAMAMAKSLGVQEFSLLASAPVYPDNPRFTMYIIDEILAKNDPDTYLNGRDGISAVSAKAIPAAQFASRSRGGGNFLAVIYFHDQLPKDTAIQVGFSEFANRKDSDYRATMRPVYSTGKGWPVVFAPFKLERAALTPTKLHALVIVNGAIVDSTQLR